VRLLQHAPKLGVRVSPERVQIHSQASRKYDRILTEIQRLIPVSVRCKFKFQCWMAITSQQFDFWAWVWV
jgi:hypothetical protein